jgi:hypothetical protein
MPTDRLLSAFSFLEIFKALLTALTKIVQKSLNIRGCIENNRNLGDFFMFFSKFFSKMTLLGLILYGESMTRIPNPSLTLNHGIGVCVLKRKSKNFRFSA